MERQEARESLETIDTARGLTRRAVARAGTGYFFVIWGIVWLAGFLGSELLPPGPAGYLWLALDAFGLISSVLVGVRLGRRVRSLEGRNSGLRSLALWLLLLIYGGLLYVVADPPPERGVVFVSLFVSFGYVVAGLSISTPLLLTGLGISLLTLLAWVFIPAYLGLSLAIICGGGMIVAGLMMLRAWE